MLARLRLAPVWAATLVCAALLSACPNSPAGSDPPDSGGGPTGEVEAPVERPRELDTGEPRLDPTRCTGDALDIEALVKAGVCTIPQNRAQPLPAEDQLAIELPGRLKVAPGEKLEFDIVLRNTGKQPLELDLVFRGFLPLNPESTTLVKGNGAAPDPSCTLQPMSTEPPPERITLPPGGELALPAVWFANTRLVDPGSYVGSECPDFPALDKGEYRSLYRIGGIGGGRSVEVGITVK